MAKKKADTSFDFGHNVRPKFQGKRKAKSGKKGGKGRGGKAGGGSGFAGGS